MYNMNNVTQPIQAGVSGVVNTVKSVGDDVVSVKFYKSPALYVFLTYVIILTVYYNSLSKVYKEKGLFGSKFMNNDSLNVYALLTYPYGFKTVPNIIKTILGTPISLYLIFFTVLFPSLMKVEKTGSSPFYYSVMVSYAIMLLLFLLHVAVVRLLIKPKNIEVSDEFGKKQDTYNKLYRTQWLLLFFLSPIYSFIIVYLARKLG